MKIVVTILFSLFAAFSFGQSIQVLESPKVDERIELLSIVFRLAGSEEYSSTKFKRYSDKIQSHFKDYTNHELIDFVKKLRLENGVGYDAVMSMAVHLDDYLNPRIEFSDQIPDQRWGKENAMEFVRLLKKFYKDSHSESFFVQNQVFYQSINEIFLPIYEDLDLGWYTSFYGKAPTEKFVIIIGLGNGNGNYGPSITLPDGNKEVYAVLGTWETNEEGMPKFSPDSYFPLLLHEFNHSFVNYMLDTNPGPFQESGEKLFLSVKEEMKSQGYGDWKTMLNEALVRAAVVKYMKDHDFSEQEIQNETVAQLNRAFLWIEDLIAKLDEYAGQRAEYLSLENYMPKLISAYSVYSDNIKVYLDRFEEKRPKIVSIAEFTNGSQKVDPNLNTITIHFDREMRDGFSFDKGEKGESFLPEVLNVEYNEGRTSITLSVKLQSSKTYQFRVTRDGFKSTDGIPIKNYEINFATN